MKYKYPFETHTSMGYKDLDDFYLSGNEYCLSREKILTDFEDLPRQSTSGVLKCSYDDLKNLLDNPIKIKASAVCPKTPIDKARYYGMYSHHHANPYRVNFLGTLDISFNLSDVLWLVKLTDKKYKGRVIKDWLVIRNIGNGKNTDRFLNHNYKLQGESEYASTSFINKSFKEKVDWFKRYSRYEVDSRTYSTGESASSIWLDAVYKKLDTHGVFNPVKVSENKHWLVSKYKWHDDKLRSINEATELLNYYLEENRYE